MNTSLKAVLTGALLALAVSLVANKAWAVNTPADATITVTPVADITLTVDPTTYAFGSLDVAASSVAASSITLTNSGQVDVTVNKAITTESNPGGWSAATIASASPGANKYALYVATSTTRPATGDFVDADHLFNGTGSNALKGLGGGTPTLTTTGVPKDVALWFKLAMPTSVADQTAREISLQFTGVAP